MSQHLREAAERYREIGPEQPSEKRLRFRVRYHLSDGTETEIDLPLPTYATGVVVSEVEKGSEPQGPDWFARATAISRPAAYWLLAELDERSAVDLEELEREFESADDWLALGQLMRAGYVHEGKRQIHMTWRGSEAFEEFKKQHPELAESA